MEALNLMRESLLSFMFIFKNYFLFYMIFIRGASRTSSQSAYMGEGKEEREELPKSPFEIGTDQEEGELSGDEESKEES